MTQNSNRKFSQHDRVTLKEGFAPRLTGRVSRNEAHPVYGSMVTVEIDQEMPSLSQTSLVFRQDDLDQLFIEVGGPATLTEEDGTRNAYTITAIDGDVMILTKDNDSPDGNKGKSVIARVFGSVGNRWRAAGNRFVQYGVRIQTPAEAEQPATVEAEAEAEQPATVETVVAENPVEAEAEAEQPEAETATVETEAEVKPEVEQAKAKAKTAKK